MTLTAVVAVGSNQVIGRDGQMPWPSTGDMRHFKTLTWGHPIVMGRTTFESIGKPLPGRTSVVLTRNPEWDPKHPDVIVVSSLAEGLAKANALDSEVFLIGGGLVFSEARSAGVVDRMVITEVPLAPLGDSFFDPIDPAEWRETSRESHQGTPDFEIVTFERVAGEVLN